MNSSSSTLDLVLDQELLVKLKKLIGKEAENHTDDYLSKFLFARGTSPVKAAAMFQNTMEWRKTMEVDLFPYPEGPVGNNIRGFNFIADQDLDLTAENIPHGWNEFVPHLGGGCYHKTDKNGFPVYIELFGKVNAKKLAQCDQSRLMHFHLYNLEFMIKKIMPECSQKSGKIISKHTVIFDLSGLGLSRYFLLILDCNLKALSVLKSLADVDQAYYPELLHRIFVINAPLIFTSIWNIIKMWLDKRTLDKVRIMGSSYSKELLEYIDKENLPQAFGGECTCSHLEKSCVPGLYKE